MRILSTCKICNHYLVVEKNVGGDYSDLLTLEIAVATHMIVARKAIVLFRADVVKPFPSLRMDWMDSSAQL